MKIECKYPFTEDFDSAYLVRSQGRNIVCLYSTVTKQRSSMSYARYLMSTHLGRELDITEHVDHINNIKDDDRIDNLQILSHKGNSIKYHRECTKGKRMVRAECPVCGTKFTIAYNKISNRAASCCSRSCGGRLPHIKGITNKKIILEDFYQLLGQ